MAANARIVAGVDGCPGGFIMVICPAGAPDAARASFCATFAEVLAGLPADALICVDMPIGLPARGGRGGRAADVAARRKLGARQSSVFAVPARAAVMAPDYASACATAAAHSDPPRKVAKQTFHLFPKIREIDSLMTPDLQERVVECHPELSFWALNGGCALALPKKVKSRPYAAGLELRTRLLAQAGFDPKLFGVAPFRLRDVGPDDLLDAAACCATALRILAGTAVRLPEQPERDERGLRMEIWG